MSWGFGAGWESDGLPLFTEFTPMTAEQHGEMACLFARFLVYTILIAWGGTGLVSKGPITCRSWLAIVPIVGLAVLTLIAAWNWFWEHLHWVP